MSEREDAWEELHAATPPGWLRGTPRATPRRTWAIYAVDTTEKAHIGRRSREWTAVGLTQTACIREMARCLREIGEGRLPP